MLIPALNRVGQLADRPDESHPHRLQEPLQRNAREEHVDGFSWNVFYRVAYDRDLAQMAGLKRY